MNPAARLLTIYDVLIQQQKDQPLMHTWAAVFELDTVPPHLEDDVTSCIVALRQQIDYTRVRLSEHGVPFELTNPGFDRFKSIASPSLLASPWSSQRGNIQPPECRHAFAWAAWVLHDEDELAMQSEDMANLRAEIDSLGQNLRKTAMSPYLRDFIQRQMDTINAALRVYLVQGVRPLKDALQKVAGAYTLECGLVEIEYATAETEAKGVLNNAGVVIKKTAEVCDSLDKIKKFGESTWSLATSVGPLLLLHVDKLMK